MGVDQVRNLIDDGQNGKTRNFDVEQSCLQRCTISLFLAIFSFSRFHVLLFPRSFLVSFYPIFILSFVCSFLVFFLSFSRSVVVLSFSRFIESAPVERT